MENPCNCFKVLNVLEILKKKKIIVLYQQAKLWIYDKIVASVWCYRLTRNMKRMHNVNLPAWKWSYRKCIFVLKHLNISQTYNDGHIRNVISDYTIVEYSVRFDFFPPLYFFSLFLLFLLLFLFFSSFHSTYRAISLSKINDCLYCRL